MDNDWLANFFQKSAFTSDDNMQRLWAKILAGEANHSGKFSRRTVNMLADFSQKDAEIFAILCQFVCKIDKEYTPVIVNHTNKIYADSNLTFDIIHTLEAIGLITFIPDSSLCYFKTQLPETTIVQYHNESLNIFPDNSQIKVGSVIFTSAGEELSQICITKPIDGFANNLREYWKEYLVKRKS